MNSRLLQLSTQLRGGVVRFTTSANSMRNVVVYGSGQMGAGIAQVTAQSGMLVTMVDVGDDQLQKGKERILSSLKRIARKKYPESTQQQEQEKFIHEIISKINTTTEVEAPAKTADLVIEAIVENLEIKKQLFQKVDKVAPSSTILTSNTSSFSIREIGQVTNRTSKVAGLHFFNPVAQMKLVEVIETEDTSDETIKGLFDFCQKLNKTPIKCKDTPGFVVNRLLTPYLMEALRMLEREEASKEDIDTGMKLGAGYPMGPFELMDYIGLDTLKSITDGWYTSRRELKGNKLVEPSKTLNELVEKGHLGRKTGRGFYDYGKEDRPLKG